MIRGIEFILPSKNGKYLNDILATIQLENKICHVEFNEIYLICENENLKSAFEENKYDGLEFNEIIKNNEQFLIFLELFIYPNISNCDEIVTYDDFINSNCEMILLVSDSIYVELYHKSVSMLKELYLKFEKLGYLEIVFKDENDARYRMTVS